MQLRPYQSKAIEDLWQWFSKHPSGHPILELPTGSGKSIILAEICRQALTNWPGSRILMTVKSKELCEQNLEELLAIWPDAPAGVHSASVGRKDIGQDILYTTIGSIYKKAHLLGKVDLILVDECHMVDTKDAGMYRKLISELQKYCPHVRVIGVTATPFKADGVWLTAGENPLFTGIASKIKMRELLDAGYLAPLVSAGHVKNVTSSDGVAVVNGDYNISQLADRLDRAELVDACCREMVELAADRKKWIVFGVTVEHAGHIKDKLTELGVACEVVTGDTPKAERARSIALFKEGYYRCLVTVLALGTGFNAKDIDFIGLMRNTKSLILYLQLMGRGLRIAPGKKDCMVADFTDTTATLGPIDLVTGRGPKRKMPGERPVKLCEACGSINAVSARECVDCGAPFEIAESTPHGAQASLAAIMSGQQTLTRYTVDKVTYAKHQKPGKPPCLRVDYWHGLRVVAKEWISLESDNQFGRGRAVNWWIKREPKPMEFVPRTVDQALEWINGGFDLTSPTGIIINESGKYPEIINYEWSNENELYTT